MGKFSKQDDKENTEQKINWKPLKQFFKGLFAVLVGIVTFIAGAFWGLISLAFSLTKKK